MRIQPTIYLLFALLISIQVPVADEKSDLSGIAGEYSATGGVELLAGYVNAKFAAHSALNAAFEGIPQGSVTPCP